ncbi:synaptogenesis protein syg-2-like [Macrosteles quadrilineatus]|uniref:synaptogenesis protein syg-2-like n=1 Tax=Macrosteles quadrilineatus TaxID=74068 RepID=UPI0023E1F8F5|nr:synaptogenesis protein syg-2-like [Macrosteles quadrilineatus]
MKSFVSNFGLLACFVAAVSFLDTTFAQGPPQVVQAVVKGSAVLPCDMTAPVANDSVLLVVWYKSDMRPIYSYDLRKKDLKDNHWHDRDTLGGRAYFRTMSEPAGLVIDTVELTDEADYRCRVDFRKSPTRNYKVKLIVTVPPEKPYIIDDRGKEIQELAGPYEEGSEMNLRCIVKGGQPPPVVKWWRGPTLLEARETNSSRDLSVRESRLLVRRLDRSDLHATYTCTASNNNVTTPVSAAVRVEMHFKPLSAQILTSYVPLSAERKVEIVCQAIGSRPPAKISWWKDNKHLDDYTETVSTDGNVTISTLMFKPTLLDHEKTLTCRADNQHVKAGAEEDSWKLNIYFIPVLQLELGSKMNPNDIEEGDDVYFECKIHANPAAYKVVWRHNNQVVQHNQKLGVIVSNQDLALQSVKRNQAGNYTCTASNVEGDGESNMVQLKVMYAPMCKPDQKRVYGVAKEERANVLCEVDSYPQPEEFVWKFNNSAMTQEVAPERYTSALLLRMSTLTYIPQNELDFGTVMCWAKNAAGAQLEPCVFHIIAAGHPDPPLNCTVTNQTSESLEVECLEGFDGGQQQKFHLEVRDVVTERLVANKTSLRPSFLVDGLGPGRVMRMLLYSSNAKGKSDALIVEGFTLKAAEKQTGPPVGLDVMPLVGVGLLATTVLLVCLVIVLGAIRLRTGGGAAQRPQVLAIKDKATLPLRSDVQDLYDMDDKNPDLIPCNKGSDYQLVSNVGTPAAGDVTTPTPPTAPLYDDNTPRNNVISRNGDLYDNYKNNYLSQRPSDDVTYAELCLSRPTSLVDRGRDPTIYAEIDHNRRANLPHSLVSPATHREIVTVRTPLMGSQQESCV